MTIEKLIIDFLSSNPEPIDDDQLSLILNLKRRQQANDECRKLEKAGLIIRQRINGKIHNIWIRGKSISLVREKESSKNLMSNEDYHKLWFWEGNVQAQIVNFLTFENYLLRSVVNTASRQKGVDIIAEKDEKEIWISVKGFPKVTQRTNPSTQAAHWFKDAIFDVVKYRNQNSSLRIGVGLPIFDRYKSLSNNVSWFKEVSGFNFFWVSEAGKVFVE